MATGKNAVTVYFLGDSTGLKKTVSDVEQTTGGISTKLKGLFAGIGVAGIAAGITKAVNAYSDGALAAKDFSTMSGLSIEQASKWNVVTQDLGLSADTVAASFFKLNKNLGAGTAKAATDAATAQKALQKQTIDLTVAQQKFNDVSKLKGGSSPQAQKALIDLKAAQDKVKETQSKLSLTLQAGQTDLSAYGVAIAKTKDGMVDSNATFLNALKRIRDLTDPIQKDAIAMKLFGRSAAELAPLIDQLDTLQGRLDSVNSSQVFHESDAKNVRSFKDSIEVLKNSLKGFEDNLGRGLIPTLTGVFTWVAKLNPQFVTIGIVTLGAALAFSKLAPAIGLAGQAFGFLLANPWVVVIAGIGLAVFELAKHWDTVTSSIEKAFAALSAWFGLQKQALPTASLGGASADFLATAKGSALLNGSGTRLTNIANGTSGIVVTNPITRPTHPALAPAVQQTVIQHIAVTSPNAVDLNKQLALAAAQTKRARG
jgi:hypothetical protein